MPVVGVQIPRAAQASLAQSVEVSGLEPEGCGFESHSSHKYKTFSLCMLFFRQRYAGVAQLVEESDLKSEGRGFKSHLQ